MTLSTFVRTFPIITVITIMHTTQVACQPSYAGQARVGQDGQGTRKSLKGRTDKAKVGKTDRSGNSWKGRTDRRELERTDMTGRT
jgi:hypothetical protein